MHEVWSNLYIRNEYSLSKYNMKKYINTFSYPHVYSLNLIFTHTCLISEAFPQIHHAMWVNSFNSFNTFFFFIQTVFHNNWRLNYQIKLYEIIMETDSLIFIFFNDCKSLQVRRKNPSKFINLFRSSCCHLSHTQNNHAFIFLKRELSSIKRQSVTVMYRAWNQAPKNAMHV
jgi:hypothetical protein